jgi:hypothetical protein
VAEPNSDWNLRQQQSSLPATKRVKRHSTEGREAGACDSNERSEWPTEEKSQRTQVKNVAHKKTHKIVNKCRLPEAYWEQYSSLREGL